LSKNVSSPPARQRPCASSQRAVVFEQVERADRDAAGVEARSERLVERGIDVAMLQHRFGDSGEHGELGRECGAPLREPGVEHHLALELTEHAAVALALELVELGRLDRGRLALRAQRLAQELDQLAELGRAHDEIVRARAVCELAIRGLDVARRHEHERHALEVRVLAQRHREAKAVHLRHHHVGDDRVGTPAPDRFEGADAIGRRLDLEAESTEPEASELELQRIIVGDHEPAPVAELLLARHRRRNVRLDQRQQPRRRDRLRNDVVEADRRDPRLIELRYEAREREDRDVGTRELAQLADEREAIRVGQHQILQHDVRPLARHQLTRGRSVGGFEHLVALPHEGVLDHPPGRRVVVDDHDLALVHAPPFAYFAISSGSARVSIGFVT
jgi:hypothetical protein